MSQNVTEKKSMFTVKRVLRVLTSLCIIFVFCPSFLISCSGEKVNVNAMTAVGGISSYGERIVEPKPLMLLCLLLPIVVLILLFGKKIADKNSATIILICYAVDLGMWILFRLNVKKFAEENYCTYKTTVWYVFNMIALLSIILLSALVVMNKAQMDSDLIAIFTGGGIQGTLDKMSSTMSQMSSTVSKIASEVAGDIGNKTPKEKPIGFCSKCGSPIEYGCRFCTSCGTPVPDDMLEEAEAARKAEEEAEAARKAEEEAEAARKAEEEAEASMNSSPKPMFCQKCGTKLESDAAFCMSCGTKIE